MSLSEVGTRCYRGLMRHSILAMGILAVGLLGGCYEAPPMTIEGNLSVSGERLGEWTLDPGICAGGFYKGVDVSSRDGQQCVRFIDDPEIGPHIFAFIPGEFEGVVFTEDQCEEFYVRLDRTVDQDGFVYNHGGVIDVECSTEDGTVSGRVEFDGCW